MKTSNITRFLTVVCVMFAFGTTVQAQSISVGAKLGAVNNHIFGTPDGVEQDFDIGPQFGIFAIYSSDVNWGVGAELMWTRKELTAVPQINGTDMRADYLEVPILGYYFFGELDDKVRPKLYAGPAFSYKINETDHTGDDFIKDFDLGATVGTGLNVDLGSSIWLNMDLRHNFGFVDIRDENSAIFTNTSDRWTNGTTSLQIGVAVGL